MARAATPEESFPPIVDAGPEIVEAVRAYQSATRVEEAAYLRWRSQVVWPRRPDERTAHAAYTRARRERGARRDVLEEVIPNRPGWHLVEGRLWGWCRASVYGLELVSRPDRCELGKGENRLG